jgi:hypothetical protein
MTSQEIQDRITKYDLLFEGRLTATETTCKHLIQVCNDIKYDMRWGFGIIIGLFGVVFGLMAKGFHWY